MKNFTKKFLPKEKIMQILSALREKCFVFVTIIIIIYYYIYDYTIIIITITMCIVGNLK